MSPMVPPVRIARSSLNPSQFQGNAAQANHQLHWSSLFAWDPSILKTNLVVTGWALWESSPLLSSKSVGDWIWSSAGFGTMLQHLKGLANSYSISPKPPRSLVLTAPLTWIWWWEWSWIIFGIIGVEEGETRSSHWYPLSLNEEDFWGKSVCARA